jgi:hypothetical protein
MVVPALLGQAVEVLEAWARRGQRRRNIVFQ